VYCVKSLRFAGAACGMLGILAFGQTVTPAQAGEAQAAVLGPSGLPLPRFVSLKSGRVNLRIGPGRDYPVQWLYLKPGLPVEIVQEYDNWRRIRDSEGTEGWVLQTLLTGKRTAIAAPWAEKATGMIGLFGNKDEAARRVADMEPGVMGKIEDCDGVWCTFESAGYDGYVRQAEIWGAYPGETFEN
jgi:SH3-like domain-containing protein